MGSHRALFVAGVHWRWGATGLAPRRPSQHVGRMLRSFFPVIATCVVCTPVAAAPLQPTGKWEVQYADSSCVAKRSFGDHILAIQPAPLGLTTRIIVEAPGRAMRARQYPATIVPEDGVDGIKASTLIYPLATKGRRGMQVIVPTATMDRIEKGGRLRIFAGHKARKSTGGMADAAEKTQVDLALGSTASLSSAMDTCMADLRKHWGMVDGKLPEPPQRTSAKGDVRALFTGDDYPLDAMSANQSGTTRMLLMIDEKGNVIDCAVTESSGVATLDAMGCQVIRERARFTPALDANGKPTRDTVVTPPVRWMISG